MAIPLLKVNPKTQNQRVDGYDVTDEDDPVIYRLTDARSSEDVDRIIWAAYRQIFAEHLILKSNRQVFLESQLRNRKIGVADFVRGLGKSDIYRELVAETNSNYRLVDITLKRFLGRASYGRDEQIAKSIVIATKGLHGFIDELVDGEEYRENFGDDIVPYQRRRLEGRPFNLTNPRYGDFWRNRLLERELATRSYYQVRSYNAGDLDKEVIRQAIPFTFLNMAQSLSTPHLDTQRHVARATSSAVKVPDSSREAAEVTKPTVSRPKVNLPYSYIPGTTKV
ncbi:phycobilisome rod-core linker polypeptide [Leptolyngbya sp. NIES-2104]|uniref:phycobilisome rod-core linker polypeptide n=1 Tax=Leptolyngbya sp. NIES-2104 TaxID=1552121 RepID=UPI0006EC4827|nr:phycobilisome rod-core linker polypeptide [Leptolyngbya sp. NIES-2104]GAP95397.1 phycobilisome rod-core linker polypeptide, phycocyanin-associated [Leptolyngbya sp. NIES-2104]